LRVISREIESIQVDYKKLLSKYAYEDNKHLDYEFEQYLECDVDLNSEFWIL